MLSLSTDDDGKGILSRRPAKIFKAFDSSSSAYDDRYYEPLPTTPPRRRWRLLRSQSISLPTIRARGRSPWQTRRRIRQLVVTIAVVALLLIVLVDQFLRAHGYRGQDAKETIKRLFRPSTCVFDQRELRRVWEWEILSGHYPTRRKSACPVFARFACLPLSILSRLTFSFRVFSPGAHRASL